MNVTVHVDTAPADDFGTAPPAFGDAPVDPNRPLRRKK